MSAIDPNASPFICGLDVALRVIGGKWKPLVLFFLAKQPLRYGALKRSVSRVSDKVLIQQLKELEADGVIARHDHKEVPPRVDYSLTPFGRSLAAALVPLCQWGEQHADDVAEALARRPVA